MAVEERGKKMTFSGGGRKGDFELRPFPLFTFHGDPSAVRAKNPKFQKQEE
jgi:hypothetical protein